MKNLPRVPVLSKYIPFFGGLDTETPTMQAKPGRVRSSQNVYQGVNGGYKTFSGYERYSGKAKPSSASYSTIWVTLTGAVSVGDVVTDSAATSFGTVLRNNTTHLILSKVTGTLAAGNIKVGATVVGTCTGVQTSNSASTRRLAAEYKSLAANLYRADIAAIPGSGIVRGVWYYNGHWYGIRNNALGTAMDMYVDSAAGWVLVPLGRELSFTSGGTYEPVDGDVIVGETSGATATVTRVVLQDGSFAAGTAAGRYIFASQTGTFQAETIKVGTNLNIANIAGDSTAITLANPNGRFEFINANFTGNQDTTRMYGVDGVNRGFEFDGTVFVPIETGMTLFPSHVIEHKYHLFYSFLGSAQHSAPGLPYQWTPVFGADEIGLSDHITAFITQPGNETSAALSIITKNSIGVLYGTSTLDWNLALYKRGTGGIEWSSQFIGNTFTLDDRGITKLSTSAAYGNFADATVSLNYQSWLQIRKVRVTASCTSMDNNLYCLFFFDKSSLFCTVNGGEIKAAMPMLFANRVCCICEAEDTSGNEVIMFGDENGYIHQMFIGTSQDGADNAWRADLVYDHHGSPTVVKRYRKATLECTGDGYTEFRFGYSLWYGSGEVAQTTGQLLPLEMGVSSYDSGSTYDSGLKWDGQTLTPSYFDMSGSGTNISLSLSGNSTFFSALKFSGALLQYSQSRETR